MLRTLQKLLAPLRRRLSLLVTRAVLSLVDDSPLLQEVQTKLLAGEVLDGLERFQNYGFTSVPHPGAEGVALSVGGHRSHTVVVAVDDRRYRLKALEGGEVAIYTDEGDRIHLKRGRIIHLITETLRIEAGTKVEITTPVMAVNTTTHTVSASQQATIASPALSLGGTGDAVGTMYGRLHVTREVTTDSSVTSAGDHVAGGISQISHVHPENDEGGPTDPPMGG